MTTLPNIKILVNMPEGIKDGEGGGGVDSGQIPNLTPTHLSFNIYIFMSS